MKKNKSPFKLKKDGLKLRFDAIKIKKNADGYSATLMWQMILHTLTKMTGTNTKLYRLLLMNRCRDIEKRPMEFITPPLLSDILSIQQKNI